MQKLTVRKGIAVLLFIAAGLLVAFYNTEPRATKNCLYVAGVFGVWGILLYKEINVRALIAKHKHEARPAQGGVEPRPRVMDLLQNVMNKHAQAAPAPARTAAPATTAAQIAEHPSDPDNPFELYDAPQRGEATAQLKSVCKKAATMVASAMIEFDKIGATDKESKVDIIKYLGDEINKRL